MPSVQHKASSLSSKTTVTALSIEEKPHRADTHLLHLTYTVSLRALRPTVRSVGAQLLCTASLARTTQSTKQRIEATIIYSPHATGRRSHRHLLSSLGERVSECRPRPRSSPSHSPSHPESGLCLPSRLLEWSRSLHPRLTYVCCLRTTPLIFASPRLRRNIYRSTSLTGLTNIPLSA